MAQKQLQIIQQLIKFATSRGSFESSLKVVQAVKAGDGWCNYSMKFGEEHLNRTGEAIHGGVIATMVDCLSTFTLMTVPPHKPGVSASLSVEYLRAAQPGDDVIIETRVMKAGKTLAFLDVSIKKEEDGTLLYLGKHIKHLGS